MESIFFSYMKAWDLRYLNQSENGVEDNWISNKSSTALVEIINTYPENKTKIVFLLEDIVIGNIITNTVILHLLYEEKIKTRAFRINALNLQEDTPSDFEILVIDNLDFDLITQSTTTKANLINLIDSQFEHCKLIFINSMNFKSSSLKSNFKWLYNQMTFSLNIKINSGKVIQ